MSLHCHGPSSLSWGVILRTCVDNCGTLGSTIFPLTIPCWVEGWCIWGNLGWPSGTWPSGMIFSRQFNWFSHRSPGQFSPLVRPYLNRHCWPCSHFLTKILGVNASSPTAILISSCIASRFAQPPVNALRAVEKKHAQKVKRMWRLGFRDWFWRP